MSVALALASAAMAGPARDPAAALIALAAYDQARLPGQWYEVAQTPTFLERDCHGTTVTIETRDDSRLTMKIACRFGALDGPILPIDGVMVQTAPGVFEVRLVRLPQIGNLRLVVVWAAADDSLVALASPRGEIGWIWARSPHPDPAGLDEARQALVAAGYRASAIRDVPQAP